jgi:two-component system sensor histidine kinase ChvG
MIDLWMNLRPLRAGVWTDAASRATALLRDVAGSAATALTQLAVWLAAAAEPALDWLARQRWLGGLFSSVVGKIVALNLLGLLVLTSAILFFSPIQASLVQAKLEGMILESEVIADSIAATATRESDRVVVDPDLLEPGQNAALKQAMSGRTLSFPIRPERLASIVHRVVDNTGMRIRLFRTDGTFMYDSQEQPESSGPASASDSIHTFWTWLIDQLDGTDLPVYRDLGRSNVTAYPQFKAALDGISQGLILVNDRGRRTVTIATPVKRRDYLGVMLLSTRDGEIDKLVWAERKTVLWLGAAGLMVMAVTSLLLAGTIALPLRKLANAADRVQTNLKRKEDLPNFDYRGDEVGHLSKTLRSMTEALYKRIESSERFAADVAHELKNPLTSVRSAAETLPRVKSEADRKLLTDTIQNDVKRLTRLIDDISKATRADAEMALNVAEPVDLADLLSTLTEMFNNVHVRNGQTVVTEFAACDLPATQAYTIQGHDIRLGQVFKNLLDNALSFSPPSGRAWIKAQRIEGAVLIAIEDEGPGIPPGNLEKIFNRFYTDRPVGSFGNNSGLGLSICKEIVIAHGGKIWAENRLENSVQKSGTSELGVVSSTVTGARFLVELPAAYALAGQRNLRAKAYARR